MHNFAEQCLDMARSILSHNLGAINENGTIIPVEGETSRVDESGHAAHAIGEYYRATQETTLAGFDLVDLAARAITAQAFIEAEHENGLAYASMGLLSFGPSKERNIVWERLMPETQERLDKMLLARTDYDNHLQVFNIAKAVCRFSLGLSKKDETSALIDKFIERVQSRSSGGFVDDSTGPGLGGVFDIYGVMSFVFIRQSLQLHANVHLRDRKLPTLRTYAEKYLKMFPDLVRADGLGWDHGRGIGAYGQMHLISLTLQAMRDNWITEDQKPVYNDVLRRLFQFFYMTYLDQEHGFLVIRDAERSTQESHTTRMANFDAARYLCQWARLARTIGGSMANTRAPAPKNNAGRYVGCDKSNRKEQGVFIYQDAASGLQLTIPLLSGGKRGMSDTLAFPHCPGIFDWPVEKFLPVMIPELTFNGVPTVPSFYGKGVTTSLGARGAIVFKYDQPDLIDVNENIVPDVGSVKVAWTLSGGKITGEFTYSVKKAVQLDRIRYCLAIGYPHSHYNLPSTCMLGAEGLRCNVEKDDFQCIWQETETVSNEADYKTSWGKLHYVQTLMRDHPLIMRPGQQYKLVVSFEPAIASVENPGA